jgi:hypothetical protein
MVIKELLCRRTKMGPVRCEVHTLSEALFADSYYLKNWEEKWKEKGIVLEDCNVIFISAWYRRLLGIENIGEIIDLSVKP